MSTPTKVRWLTPFIIERIHEHQIAEHGCGMVGDEGAGLVEDDHPVGTETPTFRPEITPH